MSTEATEVNQIYKGQVSKVTQYGAFVDLPTGDTGLVHISEVDRSYVKSISDFLHEGDEVDVKVLAIKEDGKIDLSIKACQEPQSRPRRFKRDNPEFEKMMKKFKRQSEEKLVDLRRNRDSKRG